MSSCVVTFTIFFIKKKPGSFSEMEIYVSRYRKEEKTKNHLKNVKKKSRKKVNVVFH